MYQMCVCFGHRVAFVETRRTRAIADSSQAHPKAGRETRQLFYAAKIVETFGSAVHSVTLVPQTKKEFQMLSTRGLVPVRESTLLFTPQEHDPLLSRSASSQSVSPQVINIWDGDSSIRGLEPVRRGIRAQARASHFRVSWHLTACPISNAGALIPPIGGDRESWEDADPTFNVAQLSFDYRFSARDFPPSIGPRLIIQIWIRAWAQIISGGNFGLVAPRLGIQPCGRDSRLLLVLSFLMGLLQTLTNLWFSISRFPGYSSAQRLADSDVSPCTSLRPAKAVWCPRHPRMST
ncbi:hypothetical protein K438DRAFT_1933320 [Mycena galopus ATCC 62051]|nr:hypothetical protein K438DRAFT_1933320 [Mycena galopus ATCC 62051]